jgi:hypothetical protein
MDNNVQKAKRRPHTITCDVWERRARATRVPAGCVGPEHVPRRAHIGARVGIQYLVSGIAATSIHIASRGDARYGALCGERGAMVDHAALT